MQESESVDINSITEDDLRAALKEIGSFVDITESDLKKIFEIAVRISKERCINTWLAQEIMTRNVITVKPDSDIYEAGRIMIRNKVSGLPVVDDENHVIGIISQADLLAIAGMPRGHVFNDVVMKYILRKPTPRHRDSGIVSDIMTSKAITVTPHTSARTIAGIFEQRGIKRVPVVDENKKLVGIVTRGDIVRVVCEDSKKTNF